MDCCSRFSSCEIPQVICGVKKNILLVDHLTCGCWVVIFFPSSQALNVGHSQKQHASEIC